MPLSKTEVEHVASLAHIALTDDEIEEMAHELSSIVDHVARLGEVDTSEVDPVITAAERKSVLRDDVVAPPWPVRAVLANAPHAVADQFEVQAVLD